MQLSAVPGRTSSRVPTLERWTGVFVERAEVSYRMLSCCGMLAFFYPDQDKTRRVSQRPAGRLVSPMLLLPTKSSCVTVCTEYKGRLLLWMVETKINQGTQALSSTLLCQWFFRLLGQGAGMMGQLMLALACASTD